MSTILIVDDDKGMSGALMQAMTALGHAVSCAYTLADGLRKSLEARPDVVFLDVRLPDGDGLAALATVRAAPSEPEVIVFTGEGDPDAAEMAIRNGAWDCLQKPATVSSMALLLGRALEHRAENMNRRPVAVLKRGGIIGEGARMRESLDHLARAAATDSAVMLTGETGTGKALFASAIHDNSARAAGDAPAAATDTAFPKFRAYRRRAADAAEHQYLTDLMTRAGNDLRKACAVSGLSRPRLYALLSKHGIHRKG